MIRRRQDAGSVVALAAGPRLGLFQPRLRLRLGLGLRLRLRLGRLGLCSLLAGDRLASGLDRVDGDSKGFGRGGPRRPGGERIFAAAR